MYLVTAAQMQAMDSYTINEFGIPGLVLMENAGRGAFDMLMETFDPDESTRVAVVTGRGNNGGDGWVIARYLMENNIPITVFLLSDRERVAGDAQTNMVLVEKLLPHHPDARIVEIPDADTLNRSRSDLVHHDLFVDAIFGTGLNSDVRGFFRDVIQWINDTGKPVFSVDIPSGLNSDSGAACGIAVRAAATATFAFAKAGHILHPGNDHTGDLQVIDIGIPGFAAQDQNLTLQLLENDDIIPLFPPREFNSHKGSYGHLLILAGSTGKTGAAALCANAAARCGTGLVTLGVPGSANTSLEAMVVEPMTVPLAETGSGTLSVAGLKDILDLMDGKQALGIGPGIGTDPDTCRLVRRLVAESTIPMVIDADGLNCLALSPDILKSGQAPLVLTPHPGEMARLSGLTTREIQADRLGVATQFAREFQVILVLKGAQTVIALPDRRAFVCPTGNPGMATGGMGDVLTGMIAGLAAQGYTAEEAALAGVFIHGLCGDVLAREFGGFGFLASDMVDAIPQTISQITDGHRA